jgi:hypothetical protein
MADWWKALTLARETASGSQRPGGNACGLTNSHSENDLYLMVHHEIGHAMFFNPANTLFAEAKSKRKLQDPALREYLGSDRQGSQLAEGQKTRAV